MNVLITAGNTQAPIDRVRCLTNIFTGRTGAAIALAACARGHHVTLLTSHPDTVAGTSQPCRFTGSVLSYRTYAELELAMANLVPSGGFHAIVHAAAVSDYLSAGVYGLGPDTNFDPTQQMWLRPSGPPTLVDRAASKVKSDEPELWLRLTRAPKLIDRIRTPWNFCGKLVKFKLEVDVDDAHLLEIAETSRRQSQADWMVANTLEGAADCAFLGPFPDGYHKLRRHELPDRLLTVLEATQ